MELLPLPTLSVDFLDHINDAVIVLDSGSQVHYLNDAAVVLTGWKNLVAKGKTIKELFPHQGGVTGLAVEELLAGKGGGALLPEGCLHGAFGE